MKIHIHIPKLSEFALYAAAFDITMNGMAGLARQIPHVLYLKCIVAFAEKYSGMTSIKSLYDMTRRGGTLACSACSRSAAHVLLCIIDHVVIDTSTINDHDLHSIFGLLLRTSSAGISEPIVDSIERLGARSAQHGVLELMSSLTRCALFPLMSKSACDVTIKYGGTVPNHEYAVACVCAAGQADLVKYKVSQGYKLRRIDVMRATSSCDAETVKYVCSAAGRAKLINECDPIVARDFDVTYCELLLSIGIINKRRQYPITNLRSVAVAKWFLDRNMIDKQDIISNTIYTASHHSGPYVDVLHYLVEEAKIEIPRNVLTGCCFDEAPDLGVLDYCIAYGAELNGNVAAKSPLLVRYWQDHGVKVLETPVIRWSVISELIAIKPTVGALEAMLRVLRMDIHTRGMRNETLLHVACTTCYPPKVIVRYLLNHDVDVNAVDNGGRTVLHFSYLHSETDILEMLLQCGAHVNAQDNSGKTALHYANQHKKKLFVNLMIKRGASDSVLDKSGRRPSSYLDTTVS